MLRARQAKSCKDSTQTRCPVSRSRLRTVRPGTIDRLLVVVNLALAAAVAVFLVKPGGVLRATVDEFLLERRVRHFLADKWPTIIHGASMVAGDSTNIEVVFFSDYECPFCRATFPSIRAVAEGPPKTGIALRHLASTFHPNAHRAAAAAVCAGDQGRFAAMNELLLTSRLDSLSLEWDAAAASAGVPNVKAFLLCMSDSATTARISADSALAAELGIQATPTFVTRAGTFPGVKSAPELLRLLGGDDAAP